MLRSLQPQTVRFQDSEVFARYEKAAASLPWPPEYDEHGVAIPSEAFRLFCAAHRLSAIRTWSTNARTGVYQLLPIVSVLCEIHPSLRFEYGVRAALRLPPYDNDVEIERRWNKYQAAKRRNKRQPGADDE